MLDSSASARTAVQRDLIRCLLSDGSVRRSSALLAEGVQPQALADALDAAVIVRSAPGVYHLADLDTPPALLAIATASVRAPRAVVCLTTAAYVGGLLEDAPSTTWIALPLGSRTPQQDGGNEQVVRWSYRGALEVGLTRETICGVEVTLTDPARTVVDLFRYARYVGGEETAIRAGTGFLRRGGDPAAILATADILTTPAGTMRRLMTVAERWRAIQAA